MSANNPTLQTTEKHIPSGIAIAAFLAPTIGLLAMSIANFLQEANDAVFKPIYLSIGSWMPNYKGIGPYSGKETILLVTWLGSWAVLHFLLRGKELPVRPFTIAMLIGIAAATILLWPPFFEVLLGK